MCDIKVESFLTLEMLICLPEKILQMKKSDYISLLDNDAIKHYYYSNLRRDLLYILNKFNDIKYTMSLNVDNYNISNHYELRENQKTTLPTDKVSDLIEKKITSENYALKIYNKIISLSCKLTYKETIYFIDTFFAKNSEEAISEKLNISRTYLQKIKKSCLIKMYLEFYELIIKK